jgi:fimbrial chaperone protein
MRLLLPTLARPLCLALFLAAAPLGAAAASLGISPVRVELSSTVPTAAVTLRNGSDEPTVVQVRAVAWSQQAGEDVLEPTTEVIVSPPIFTLAGNAAQVVRVGLRRAPDARRELSYRIFLQEVQGPPKPGTAALQMALRIGLPVFVKPLQAAEPELSWRIARESGGALRLTASNTGRMHVQVIGAKLAAPGADSDAPPLASHTASSYLLPGQSREWRLEPQRSLPAGVSRLNVRANTDAGELSAEVALDP